MDAPRSMFRGIGLAGFASLAILCAPFHSAWPQTTAPDSTAGQSENEFPPLIKLPDPFDFSDDLSKEFDELPQPDLEAIGEYLRQSHELQQYKWDHESQTFRKKDPKEMCAGSDLNDRLLGCTELINSGQLSKERLASAFAVRGYAYAEGGNLEQAILDYSEALEIKPSDAHTLVLRGSALRAAGRLKDAIADFDKAIKLSPYMSGARLARGAARVETGLVFPAILDFRNEHGGFKLDSYLSKKFDVTTATDDKFYFAEDISALSEEIARETGIVEALRADLPEALAARQARDIELATAYALAGMYEEAADWLSQTLILDPDNLEVRGLRAWMNASLERYGAAIADYDVILQSKPQDARALTAKARVLLEQSETTLTSELIGHFPNEGESQQEIRQIAEQAVTLAPDLPEAYLVRAWVRSRQWEEREEAAADVDRAVALDPANPATRIAAARILFRLDKRSEVPLSILDDIISEDPKNRAALELRARMRTIRAFTLEKQEFSASYGDLNRAIAIGPTTRSLFERAGMRLYFAFEDYNHDSPDAPKIIHWLFLATEDASKILRIQPEHSSGIAFLEHVDTVASQYICEDEDCVASDADHDWRVLRSLARLAPLNENSSDDDIKKLQEEFDRARSAFPAALETNPDNGLAHMGRGMLAFHSGKLEEAIGEFSRALDLDPTNAAARYYRGVARSWTVGERRGSASDLVDAMRIEPAYRPFAVPFLMSAEVSDLALEKDGDLDSAIRRGYLQFYDRGLADLKKAEQENPGNINILLRRAWLLRRMGDEPGAEQATAKAAAIEAMLKGE